MRNRNWLTDPLSQTKLVFIIAIAVSALSVACSSLPRKQAAHAAQSRSFQSQQDVLRWMASVPSPVPSAPLEIRLFEDLNLKSEKRTRRPVPVLRVRTIAESDRSESRQIFEKCRIEPEDFDRERERAPLSECYALGSPKGYTPNQLADFVSESAGRSLGPDWQAVKVDLATLGGSVTGVVAFFFLDPTKLLASASAGIAVMSGANTIVEVRRSNVLDASTATLLKWNAATPELSIVTVNGSLFDNERVLRIALRRIDDGKPPLPPQPRREAQPAMTEPFELLLLTGP